MSLRKTGLIRAPQLRHQGNGRERTIWRQPHRTVRRSLTALQASVDRIDERHVDRTDPLALTC